MTSRFCTVEDCNKPYRAKGLCMYHYDRAWRGVPLIPTPKTTKICTVEGCVKKHRAKGLCQLHYDQALRNATPSPSAGQTLNNMPLREYIRANSAADENGCWIWKKGLKGNGYGSVTIKRRTKAVHRTAYEVFVGPIPAGSVVHHKCAVRACCNPDHLQLTTHQDNAAEMLTRHSMLARIAELEALVSSLSSQLQQQGEDQ